MSTFGKTTNGVSNTLYNSNRKILSQATLVEDATLTSLTIRARTNNANSKNWIGLIYADSSGSPGDLLATTSASVITGSTVLSYTANFASEPLSAGVYWIGWIHDGDGTTQAFAYRDNTTSMALAGTDTYSDGPANPAGTMAALNGPIDAYVTYTPTSLQTLTVDGEGAVTSGWADEGGSYARLQSDDGDTTRLYTPTANSVRLLTLTNTSGLIGSTIKSVTVFVKLRSLDPISNTFQIGVYVGSTQYWSSNKDTSGGTTYIPFSNTWTTNPGTGLSWTVSDIDALQIGAKKISAAGMGWTYAYAVVDYIPSTGISNKHYLGFF